MVRTDLSRVSITPLDENVARAAVVASSSLSTLISNNLKILSPDLNFKVSLLGTMNDPVISPAELVVN